MLSDTDGETIDVWKKDKNPILTNINFFSLKKELESID